LKIPITKRAGGVAQGEGPEFKPQHHQKIKNQLKYSLSTKSGQFPTNAKQGNFPYL
jgi:hypothetical protein